MSAARCGQPAPGHEALAEQGNMSTQPVDARRAGQVRFRCAVEWLCLDRGDSRVTLVTKRNSRPLVRHAANLRAVRIQLGLCSASSTRLVTI